MEYRITACEQGDEDRILEGLVEHNLEQVPKTQEKEFVDLSRKIIDENGNMIGGIVGRMYCWHVAYIDLFWVDKNHRKAGLGSQLLTEVETYAKNMGCYLIHLDTFDFQAKDFYVKMGYEVFGKLENCPPGHCRYFLKKDLK